MNKYPLEFIEWEDVTSSGAAWYDKDEMEQWCDDSSSGFIVRQCGFVLKETKNYILLCSHYKTEEKHIPEQFGHMQKIIKSLIRKRKKLKI